MAVNYSQLSAHLRYFDVISGEFPARNLSDDQTQMHTLGRLSLATHDKGHRQPSFSAFQTSTEKTYVALYIPSWSIDISSTVNYTNRDGLNWITGISLAKISGDHVGEKLSVAESSVLGDAREFVEVTAPEYTQDLHIPLVTGEDVSQARAQITQVAQDFFAFR